MLLLSIFFFFTLYDGWKAVTVGLPFLCGEERDSRKITVHLLISSLHDEVPFHNKEHMVVVTV
jgi:hypothetical protein